MKMRLCIILLFLLFTHSFGQEAVFPEAVYEKLISLDDEGKMLYLKKLCWENREQKTEQAILYGKKALDLANQLERELEKSQLNGFVGVCYLHYLHQPKTSIPYLHQSLESGLLSGDTIQMAYAYNNLGDAYYLTNNISLALDYSAKSLALFEEVNDIKGRAYTHINFGLIKQFQKRFNDALDHFYKSLKLRIELNDKNGIAYSQLEIGRTYNYLNQLDSAIYYFDKSIKVHREISNKTYTAYALNGYAEVSYKKNRYKEAEELFLESLDLNREKRHLLGIINNYIGLALVYSKTNRTKEGEKMLSEALELSKRLGQTTKIIDVQLTYIDFYKNLKDYRKSTESLTTFLALYDSLFHSLNNDNLIEIRKGLLINQKLDQAKADLEVKRSKEIYFLIIIILLIVLVGIIFWRYRTNLNLSRELKNLNESKDKLFSIIAHDLKNPFIALKGYIAILKENDLTDEERNEYINYLDNTTENTYNLLENLLNLSSTKIGKITFRPIKIDISFILENVKKSIGRMLEEKSITLDINLEYDEVLIDQDMMEIVFRNLLTNAIKYSPKNSSISFESLNKNGTLIILVKDNGTGMSKETQDTILHSDNIVSVRGTEGEKGTGLGLNLCTEFIEKHNGVIEVKSVLGQGSEFKIIIPQK